MYLGMILGALGGFFYLALHVVGSGSFPKPLTQKEERECFKKIAEGDIEARNFLVEHNLRLVAHIAKKYYTASGESDDIISIGTLGLIKAASTFDYTKSTRFATYAARCIENEILMNFRAKKKSSGDVYINDSLDTDSDGNSLTLLDLICEEQDVAEVIELKYISEKLEKLVETKLTPREKKIIIMRYGLNNTVPKTQKEIAALMGISRSYVSRIEKKALMKLRVYLEGDRI